LQPSTRPTNKKAIQAVKREIARKYALLDATSPIVNTDHAHVTMTCEQASKTRFTCDWMASNDLHDRAEGSARVIVYSKGAQATLYDEHCSNEVTGACT
jgi:hypothetical protein